MTLSVLGCFRPIRCISFSRRKFFSQLFREIRVVIFGDHYLHFLFDVMVFEIHWYLFRNFTLLSAWLLLITFCVSVCFIMFLFTGASDNGGPVFVNAFSFNFVYSHIRCQILAVIFFFLTLFDY